MLDRIPRLRVVPAGWVGHSTRQLARPQTAPPPRRRCNADDMPSRHLIRIAMIASRVAAADAACRTA